MVKRIDADIDDSGSILMTSMKVASPSIKVTMTTLASISQRSREVRYSGIFELSTIILEVPISSRLSSGSNLVSLVRYFHSGKKSTLLMNPNLVIVSEFFCTPFQFPIRENSN